MRLSTVFKLFARDSGAASSQQKQPAAVWSGSSPKNTNGAISSSNLTTPGKKKAASQGNSVNSEKFAHADDAAEKTSARMEKLIEEAKNWTPAKRKTLISSNKELQLVLKEMTDSKIPRHGREEHHAAVKAHLCELLKPRDSLVPGIRLTAFSHIRQFETIMPHAFTLTSEDEVNTKIISDSLAYAKIPTIPVPPHLFTLDQFHEQSEPPKDPDFPDPTLADVIHGRDLAGNEVVGFHGDHRSTEHMMKFLKTGHESIAMRNDPSHWADPAWMATMLSLSPDKLEAHLRENASDETEQKTLDAHLRQIKNAAIRLQKLRTQHKNTPPEADNGEAMQAVLDEDENRSAMNSLTERLLSGKKTLSKTSLIHPEMVPDQTHVLSLMSALGMPCMLVKRNHSAQSRSGAHDMIFHSPRQSTMQNAGAAFTSQDPRHKTEFFTRQIARAPALVTGPDGHFSLSLPSQKATDENETPDSAPGNGGDQENAAAPAPATQEPAGGTQPPSEAEESGGNATSGPTPDNIDSDAASDTRRDSVIGSRVV